MEWIMIALNTVLAVGAVSIAALVWFVLHDFRAG
jgi:hypothetical protein